MTVTLTDDDLPLQRIYRWERERAQQVFLTQPYGGGQIREWTWSQAVGEARRIAAHLRAQNWEPGTRVAILSKNCAWWMLADLAVWMSGHVTVPVYPSLRPQSVRHIIEHSESKACFFGPVDDPEMPRLGIPSGVHRISFPTAADTGHYRWEDLVRAVEPLAGHPTRPAHELATIIYTSGTTGVPKGVMHSFRALATDAVFLQERVHATAEDRFLSYLPLAHIVERAGLESTAYLLGAHVFFVESVDTFLRDLKRARATILLTVPRLLMKFQQGVFHRISREKLEKRLHTPVVRALARRRVLSALGLSSTRLVACGAAPLPVEVMEWYRHLGIELAEGYGMTETMITHLPRVGEVRPGHVGPPLVGVESRVAADGELLIRSPMNMLGYFKDPESTCKVYDSDQFFHTGDLATESPDGQVRIIGRIKEQFKTSKGKYVTPAPIESRLAENPAVEACCLMGAGLPSPFALVVLNPEERKRCLDESARQELEESFRTQLQAVNNELDPHERVAFLAVVDGPWTIANGFITPTMKIRRTELEGKYLPIIDGWRAQNRQVVWESVPVPETARHA